MEIFFTKEWLEQIINSTINRTIQNIRIFPIRYNSEIKNTVYIVQIPSSIDAPHLCKDKRFYKRYNFESVMMEEYEIRQLYGRKLKSKLALGNIGIARVKNDDKENYNYNIEVSVINEGEILEKDFKVNVYFDNVIKGMNINWGNYGNKRDYYYTNMRNGSVKVTGLGNPIYPDEILNVLNFEFEIPTSEIEKAYNELKIRVILFYPNGNDVFEFDFKEPSQI